MSAPEKVEITLPELYDDWPELIRDLRRFTTHTLAGTEATEGGEEYTFTKQVCPQCAAERGESDD